MDPFDTLGVTPRFSLDFGEVEKRCRELSRALHPDRYVGRGKGERRMALAKAIEVNEAWRLLRDPVRRAEALFRRAGVELGENKNGPADPMLLMEMMEKREALAQARAARDRIKLAQLAGDMTQREQAVLGALAEVFDTRLQPSSDVLSAALGRLVELRFVRRFLDEAGAAEDELT